MKHCFSLIELLIVIAIIAILASMSLPALNKARATARGVQCASNMKTLGNAAVLYSQDNRGVFAIHAPVSGTHTFEWRTSCIDYYRLFLGNNKWDTWACCVPKKMLCPEVSTWNVPGVFDGTVGAERYYGMPRLSLYSINANGIASSDYLIHDFRRVRNSSTKIHHVEIRRDGVNGGANAIDRYNANQLLFTGISTNSSVPEAGVSYAHNNRANVLFFDGHVGAHGFLQLYHEFERTKNWLPYEK